MDDATSAPRRCEVCGQPIRPDNKEGVCSRTPECQRLRMKRHREAVQPPAEQRICKICGGTLTRRNRTGICGSSDKPECRNAAKRQIRKDKNWEAYSLVIKAGDTFGRWTALEDYSRENRAILVRCECGTEKRVRGSVLNAGTSQSCGQCVRGVPDPSHEPYLTAGSVYGRLTVLEGVTYNNERVRCRCECGNETTVIATSVKLGLTKSCRCLQQETRTKHGFTGHPFYQLWNGIIDRCTNPKAQGWHNYGGRGITVCERWMDPWAFAEDIYREIGPRPEGVGKKGYALYSLDRIDNDLGYEPGNVQWGDRAQQVRNQRKVADLTQDVLRLTRERDAALARVAELEAGLQ